MQKHEFIIFNIIWLVRRSLKNTGCSVYVIDPKFDSTVITFFTLGHVKSVCKHAILRATPATSNLSKLRVVE